MGRPALTKRETRKWTFMAYLAADNNLDPAALDDLNEMELVGSTPEVAIVALLDRISVQDSKIYYVEKDFDMTKIASPVVKDLGEVNTGEPATLRSFVEFSMRTYRAERYALVLWDHGDMWFGCCWDEHPEDHLTLEEIQQALDGFVVNLVGFDACLMAGVDVAYEIRNEASVMVASEDYTPWYGWPYDTILEDLTTDPDVDEATFGRIIVDDYMESYKHTYYRNYVTLAAIDLRLLGTLVEDFACLASALITNLDEYRNAVTGAKNSADRYYSCSWISGPYIDLHAFVRKLENMEEDLRSLTSPIVHNLETSGFIYSKCNPGLHIDGGFGLTIYFPRNRNLLYYPDDYKQTDFAQFTNWWFLLEQYFGK